MSAPEKPGVSAAKRPVRKSGSSPMTILPMCTAKICFRPSMVGRSMTMCRSNRPGRSRALSRTSARLVPASTTTCSDVLKPSISVRIWFSVLSRSSLLPPKPCFDRDLPMASISSMKMMHGVFFLARANRSRTRDGPTPTNISMNSDPLTLKNGTPDSPAVALASSVLPVPGGPERMAPRGILAPRRWYWPGDFKKLTNSMISCFASSMPATSLNLTLTDVMWLNILARLFPMPKMPPSRPAAPVARWDMYSSAPMKTNVGPNDSRYDTHETLSR